MYCKENLVVMRFKPQPQSDPVRPEKWNWDKKRDWETFKFEREE